MKNEDEKLFQKKRNHNLFYLPYVVGAQQAHKNNSTYQTTEMVLPIASRSPNLKTKVTQTLLS